MQYISSVLCELNEKNINYCHFKSSSHLDKSFKGETDFDVLVSKDDFDSFVEVLKRYGGVRRYSTFNATFVNVHDYIIISPLDNKVFHFHIHLELILGKKESKNYSLGVIEDLKSYIELDSEYKIKRFCYSFELSLLVIRMCLKIRIFDPRTYIRILKKKTPFGYESLEEFNWLRERVELSTSHFFLNDQLSERIKTTIDLDLNKITLLDAIKCRHFIKKDLKEFVKLPWGINFIDGIVRWLHKFSSRRWLAHGGITVAIIGADGSGKTTLAYKLKEKIGYKLNVKHIYLGLPKNNFLKATQKIILTLNKCGLNKLSSIIDGVLNYYVASKRSYLIKKGRKYAGAGFVVIFERYPLKEFFSMDSPMDGPRINDDAFLEKKERLMYEANPDYADINFFLKTSLNTVVSRKFEHESEKYLEKLKLKVEAVNLLRENIDLSQFSIDANLDQDQVVEQVLRVIYEKLR